jgi:hypothetical protein
VNNLLTNPIYAGAYAFGRTGSRMTIENGRKRILRGHRKPRSDWAVLLVDHHAGYLSWADYERNQQLIADNANGKGMMVRDAVRKGEALLTGLLHCGHCGRRLLVSYNGTKGDIGRYHCDATRSNPAAAHMGRSMHLVRRPSTTFLKAAGDTLLNQLSALLRAACSAAHSVLMSFREARSPGRFDCSATEASTS